MPRARAEGAREKICRFEAASMCFWPKFSHVSQNVAKCRTRKGLVFGRAPGQKEIKRQASSVCRRRARENLAFLRLRVCVFGLNLALYRKMWQNDAHEKGLLLAAPPAKRDKTRLERAPKARARKIWRFEAASMCFWPKFSPVAYNVAK